MLAPPVCPSATGSGPFRPVRHASVSTVRCWGPGHGPGAWHFLTGDWKCQCPCSVCSSWLRCTSRRRRPGAGQRWRVVCGTLCCWLCDGCPFWRKEIWQSSWLGIQFIPLLTAGVAYYTHTQKCNHRQHWHSPIGNDWTAIAPITFTSSSWRGASVRLLLATLLRINTCNSCTVRNYD